MDGMKSVKERIRRFWTIGLLTLGCLCGYGQRVIEIAEPMMKVFLPDEAKTTGRAVVILPGGGYSGLAIDHEGYEWAPFFNDKGIACAVVSYRMPHGDRSFPISDAQNAIKVMRDNAKEWNLDADKIGIMGFSAGGHLASTVATHAPETMRPNFQILFYPVITMDASFTHAGSRYNLLGENPSEALVEEYCNEKQVDDKTPTAFIVLSGDDDVVPAQNSLRYYEALINKGIPSTMHVYPTGGHGWGIRKGFKYHEPIMNNLSLWLDELP